MREQLKETLIPAFLRKIKTYKVSEIEDAIISIDRIIKNNI